MQIPGPSWADPRTPNVRSYSSVINACAKAGKAEEAVQWLERLEDAGLQSDAIVYSSVTLPSRWCLFWLSSIYTILYIILETDQFFFGGAMVSKSKVIDACGKAGDTEMALCIFRRMQARGIQPHVVTYSALARPFAYKGHWQEVEDPTAEPQPWHFQLSFDLKLRFWWVKVQLQPQLFKRSVSLQAFWQIQGGTGQHCMNQTLEEICQLLSGPIIQKIPITKLLYIIVYPTCESNILNTQHNRRKFRSQTSDNMDRWKSRGGQSQRRERKKKGRRKKIREEKESEEGRYRCA